MAKETSDFIDLSDLESAEIRLILERAKRIKFDLKNGINETPLVGKHLAMVFEKPSTRTRVSFEVGMHQLGGQVVNITQKDSQLNRGETIGDTARVLSRYVDVIMMRTFSHAVIKDLADAADVPVINGLTDYSHPCQIMADILTFEEEVGPIEGSTVAWLGDCNNVAQSWIHAAEKLDFTLKIATPDELKPPSSMLNKNAVAVNSLKEAVEGADCITTDTWVSMGDSDAEEKVELLKPFQVNENVMDMAKENAIFLHCLPAHRGWEVTDAVLDGKQSRVWDEAENRMHVQKAIILWCLGLL